MQHTIIAVATMALYLQGCKESESRPEAMLEKIPITKFSKKRFKTRNYFAKRVYSWLISLYSQEHARFIPSDQPGSSVV